MISNKTPCNVMNIIKSIQCMHYNFISNFYIFFNMLFPYYNEEILNLQYKTIECINDDVIFQTNARKRKRFNMFIENLIKKNAELIAKIRQQEEEDNNINNYEKIAAEQELSTLSDEEDDCDTEAQEPENCKED